MPYQPAIVTTPEDDALTDVPTGTAMSTPLCIPLIGAGLYPQLDVTYVEYTGLIYVGGVNVPLSIILGTDYVLISCLIISLEDSVPFT